jgi:hypothetical protein
MALKISAVLRTTLPAADYAWVNRAEAIGEAVEDLEGELEASHPNDKPVQAWTEIDIADLADLAGADEQVASAIRKFLFEEAKRAGRAEREAKKSHIWNEHPNRTHSNCG